MDFFYPLIKYIRTTKSNTSFIYFYQSCRWLYKTPAAIFKAFFHGGIRANFIPVASRHCYYLSASLIANSRRSYMWSNRCLQMLLLPLNPGDEKYKLSQQFLNTEWEVVVIESLTYWRRKIWVLFLFPQSSISPGRSWTEISPYLLLPFAPSSTRL